MTPAIAQNRWVIGPNDFATKVTIPDLNGFFEALPVLPKGRTLIVEPGTRALVIDNGIIVGECRGGTYTLESFIERLQFWKDNQVTVVLTRDDDVPLEMAVQDAPTVDSVCVDVGYRWTIQISDVTRFLENLLGAREHFSIEELHAAIMPITNQAVGSVVGRLPYDAVEGPDFAMHLKEGLDAHLESRLTRYGLALRDVQSVVVRSEVDGLKERRGEQWLRARELQMTRAANAIESNELRAKLEDISDKLPVRQQLREALKSDELNKRKTKQDFEQSLLEIDTQRVLAKEERDELVQAYESRKEDRQQLRAHLLATMDFHRERELDELRLDTVHARHQKALQQEIALAELSNTEQAQQWRQELQREREHAEHRREQRHAAVQARLARLREARSQKRDDGWENLLHEQRMEGVRQDLEVAKAERASRVALIEVDLKTRLADEALKVERRQKEWELQHKQTRSDTQLDRMRKLQEMNAHFAERQQRMHVEIENLKHDSASKRELDRINAMSSLSTEALLATAAGQNAVLLAELKKHEASQEAIKAQAALNPANELTAERLKMYEKLNETESAKADAIAEAYKLAMQSQQGNLQQMIGGLAQASTPPTPHVLGVAGYAAPVAVPPPMPAGVVWHVSLSGQQSPALELAHVHQYIQTGQVTRESMVWRTGMATWMQAGQVLELAHLFPPASPPQMPGGPPPMPQ